MTLCDAQFIAWSLSRPLHKPKPYIYEYVHRRLRWVWRDVFLFPATHAVEVLQQKCVFRLFWFLPAHWISNDNNDKEARVLTFSPGCSCSRPYYTNSRAGCAKKKKKGGGATISRQFIKFQCKHPRITAKGQCFNIAASVSFQTRARSLKREETSPSPNTIWLRWWCVYGDSSSLWQKSLPLRTALSRAPM